MAIERSLEAGFPTRVGLVAMESNRDHLEQTVETLRALGVERLNVSGSYGVGRGQHYEGPLPNTAQRGHVDAPTPATTDAENGRGPKKLCITYNGEVVPCIFNRQQRLGVLGEGRSLVDIVESPELEGLASAGTLDDDLAACSRELQCSDCRFTAVALRLLGEAHHA